MNDNGVFSKEGNHNSTCWQPYTIDEDFSENVNYHEIISNGIEHLCVVMLRVYPRMASLPW